MAEDETYLGTFYFKPGAKAASVVVSFDGIILGTAEEVKVKEVNTNISGDNWNTSDEENSDKKPEKILSYKGFNLAAAVQKLRQNGRNDVAFQRAKLVELFDEGLKSVVLNNTQMEIPIYQTKYEKFASNVLSEYDDLFLATEQ